MNAGPSSTSNHNHIGPYKRSTRNNRICNNRMAPRKLRMTWPIHDATRQWQRHLASTAQHHRQHQQEQCNVEQRRQSSAITEITSTSTNTNIRNFQQLMHSGHNRPSTPGPLLIRTAMVGRRVAHVGDLFLLGGGGGTTSMHTTCGLVGRCVWRPGGEPKANPSARSAFTVSTQQILHNGTCCCCCCCSM